MASIKTRSAAVITWLVISVGCSITAWLTYRKRKRRRCPNADEWEHLGAVKTINFYPLKGGAPIRLEKVECSEYGFHANGLWERCLYALNESDETVYSGTYPRMLSVQPTIVSEKVLRLEAPNMPSSIVIDLNKLLCDPKQVVVKKKRRLVECPIEHHVWLSRVVLQRESGLRLYVKLKPLPNEAIDIFPVMVLHERSVFDVNERLKGRSKPVECQQFRGNLVIESKADVPPYDEDNWFWLKVGKETVHSMILRYNSDCLRCILVNINLDDCSRSPDFEPLKTLKKFRMRTSSKDPTMGNYYDIFRSGSINTGDPIYVHYL